MKTRLSTGFFVCVALAVAPLTAHASPLTYMEILDDPNDAGFIDDDGFVFDIERDLQRTRNFGDGSSEFQDDDSIIVLDNNVSDNFGISTKHPITYEHRFVGMPPVHEFGMATLTLDVFSVSGEANCDGRCRFFQLLFGLGPIPDDHVGVEGEILGHLETGGPKLETTTTFGIDAVGVALYLADDMLGVEITPNGTGLFFVDDTLAVRTSTLTVDYTPIPEPGTLALIGFGLAVIGSVVIRKRA